MRPQKVLKVKIHHSAPCRASDSFATYPLPQPNGLCNSSCHVALNGFKCCAVSHVSEGITPRLHGRIGSDCDQGIPPPATQRCSLIFEICNSLY